MCRKVSFLLAGMLLLAMGCAGPQLYYNQLVALSPGMSIDATAQILRLPPLSSHKANVNDAEYLFQRYQMNNGVSSSLYLIAFKNQQLLYWGYIDEFRRHPSPDLGSALDQVINPILLDRAKPAKKTKQTKGVSPNH